MDVVVLLKQVPSTESNIVVASDGVSIQTTDIKWVINPYDEFAVEEALRIREAHGGTVTILSVGNEKTIEAIRTALAMGADTGILINDPAAQGCDSMAVARMLAAALKTRPHDLIVAGQRAVDDDNFTVGTAVAELLGLPNVSLVIKQAIDGGKIRCERTIDGGTAVWEAALPIVMTTQRGLNEPRYASLPGIMKAKKKPIETLTLADLGIQAQDVATPLVQVLALKAPPARRAGKMVEGETAQAQAAKLVELLHDEAKVI